MTYSIEPRKWIYVKGYRFLSFVKNMSKNLRSNYEQKLPVTTRSSAIDALKTTSKKWSKTRQRQLVFLQEIKLEIKLWLLHHRRPLVNPKHPQRLEKQVKYLRGYQEKSTCQRKKTTNHRWALMFTIIII